MPILVPEDNPLQLFRDDGKRLDGRAVDELRPFKCKIGVLENADGSSYVEHGGNKIYAGVFGPREVHPRHLARPDRGILRVYYRMATFSVHDRKSPAPNRREHEISKIIEDAIEPVLFLELYPDSAIEVFVEVMAADGGTRCASTTAVSLALADAGIPMKSMIAGVAAGKANGQIILDCSDKEDKVGDADVPCAIQMTDEQITLLQFDGQMTPDELDLALNYVKKGAQVIFKAQTDAIKEKFGKIQDEAQAESEKYHSQESEAEKSEKTTKTEESVEKEESLPDSNSDNNIKTDDTGVSDTKNKEEKK